MHCLELAPTWKELAEKKSKEYSGRLNFGEVDCIANGDLCAENGVKAWPDLQLYTHLSQVAISDCVNQVCQREKCPHIRHARRPRPQVS